MEERKLWKERPKGGLGIFIEFGEETKFVFFKPNNYQIVEKPIEKVGTTYSEAIVKCKSLDDSNIQAVGDLLSSFQPFIIHTAPVFVFESNCRHLNKDSRLSIMREVGLVETKVLTSKYKSICFWEGRKEKKFKPSKPINLLDKNKPKSYNHAARLWKEMERIYKQAGFRILNRENSAILVRMRKSTNPQEDFSCLKMGWGVELEGTCGCHLVRSVKGIDTYLVICDEHKIKTNEVVVYKFD